MRMHTFTLPLVTGLLMYGITEFTNIREMYEDRAAAQQTHNWVCRTLAELGHISHGERANCSESADFVSRRINELVPIHMPLLFDQANSALIGPAQYGSNRYSEFTDIMLEDAIALGHHQKLSIESSPDIGQIYKVHADNIIILNGWFYDVAIRHEEADTFTFSEIPDHVSRRLSERIKLRNFWLASLDRLCTTSSPCAGNLYYEIIEGPLGPVAALNDLQIQEFSIEALEDHLLSLLKFTEVSRMQYETFIEPQAFMEFSSDIQVLRRMYHFTKGLEDLLTSRSTPIPDALNNTNSSTI